MQICEEGQPGEAAKLIQCIKEVDEALDSGGVLIHCVQGANRAPLFAAAYVMAKTLCSPIEAYTHLKRLRGIVDYEASWHYSVWTDPVEFLEKGKESLHTALSNYWELPSIVSAQDLSSFAEDFWAGANDQLDEVGISWAKSNKFATPTPKDWDTFDRRNHDGWVEADEDDGDEETLPSNTVDNDEEPFGNNYWGETVHEAETDEDPETVNAFLGEMLEPEEDEIPRSCLAFINRRMASTGEDEHSPIEEKEEVQPDEAPEVIDLEEDPDPQNVVDNTRTANVVDKLEEASQ